MITFDLSVIIFLSKPSSPSHLHFIAITMTTYISRIWPSKLEEARATAVRSLERIYDKCAVHDSTFVDPKYYSSLGVMCTVLDIHQSSASTRFYKHAVDIPSPRMEDSETKSRVERQVGVRNILRKEMPNRFASQAYPLHYQFPEAFGLFEREIPSVNLKEHPTLKSNTNWMKQ
jgi:hypothetical protein